MGIETGGREGVASIESRDLSVKEVVQIITWSFYYSQGSDPLQKEIFEYIAQKHPLWKVPAETATKTLEMVVPFATNFVQRGPHGRSAHTGIELSAEDVRMQTESSLVTFTTALSEASTNRADAPTADANMKLLKGMIHVDRVRLFPDGRQNRGAISSGPHRAEMSQFASYVLLGESAPGHPVYAEMFRDLRTAYEEIRKSPELHEQATREVRKLLDYHNAVRPDAPLTA